MITIRILGLGAVHEGDRFNRFILDGWSNRKQWRYIKDINKCDGCINTFPHRKSVLRKMFIEPNLDKGVFIKNEINSVLHLAGGFDIKYTITRCKAQ